jgi:hypothetical protein
MRIKQKGAAGTGCPCFLVSNSEMRRAVRRESDTVLKYKKDIAEYFGLHILQ